MSYYFFMDETLFPVAPAKMNTKIKNQNKTVELINESEVNILKDAGLTELSFEALLPNVRYPFAMYRDGFKKASYYLDVLEKLKTSKKPFQFIVTRKTPDGTVLFYTNIKVSLEKYSVKESAKDGLDVTVSVDLKQYRSYGIKTATIKSSSAGKSTVKKQSTRETVKETKKTYTVKSGDSLWNIAKKQYGNGTYWKQIYEANKKTIEDTAKRRGKASSSNGTWIYPGTVLTLP